jgi:non-ribosomal peptide synthetase component F
VLLERGPAQVAALLGVLKAGGCYVPLDPVYPDERLRYVVEDAGIGLLLITREGLRERVPAGAEVLCIDGETDAIARAPSVAPDVDVRPEALAYVIYTSGSTGRPKGVGVSHGAAASHLVAFADRIGITADDRVLQFASPSFDVALEQLLAPLVSGAAVLLRGADAWSPAELLQQADRHALTVVNTPPAYARGLLAELTGRTPPPSLRLVLSGGEALPPAAAEEWRAAGMPWRFVNAYGPTETVVTATAYELCAEAPPRQASRSAGRSRAGPRTCWTRGCACSRRGWPASCASAVRCWRAGTSAGRG